MEKFHGEQLAQHKKSQAMMDNVLLNVQSGIRAIFDLPNHSIPRMFIIFPEPTSKRNITGNIANIVSRSYRLFFLCECGDSVAAATSNIDGGVSHNMHFAHHEGYEIRTPKAFIQKYGRHMIKLLGAIQTLATIGGAFAPAILNASKLPADIQKALKSTDDNCLPRIKNIAEHLENVLSSTDETFDSSHCQVLDGPGLRAMESFLIKKDGNRTLGNLNRILTPDYKIKWVCDQHLQVNTDLRNLGELEHTIGTFGGTFDKKRGLVTVRLASDKTEEFFHLIGKYNLIHELDITLDFGPTTDQIRTLRQHMKSSQVSSLSINIDIPERKYIYLGLMRAVGGGAQLLKLVSREKVGKPGPFRNLSIKGVPDILEEFAFEGSDRCLAYSLTLDRVSFNWEREKSRQRLLELLDKAPDLLMLTLCCSTLAEGYAMVRELARRSRRLTTIHITTGLQEHVEFGLKAGSIESIIAAVRASELGTVAAWSGKIERLSVMDLDGHWFHPSLQAVISNHSQSLTRLDLHCPVSSFCFIFERIKAIVQSHSSLTTLCLRHGESELLTKDLSDPIATTTIKMLPEEERDLGMWLTYSLFGFFPACDASPCQLTDKQVTILRNHFQNANVPMRLQELNLDVSKLSWQGLDRLKDFLVKYGNIRIRLSGAWTEEIHDDLLSYIKTRLTGFDMTVQISGTNPLAKGAKTLFATLNRIQNTVSIQGARLRFLTDKGNTIDIPDLRDSNRAFFDIIQDDEPFDFALSRYFGRLPSKLLCDNDGFSDADVPILSNLSVVYLEMSKSGSSGAEAGSRTRL
ncbi:hypothetical protein BGZ96_000867 [Linnemannia gamsii]|uniref:Uncharacterized protein n=1 Tax=Linnemannia gamsii TaxID=64522 RepID=A0ABQ7K9L9_9FUNG|nr:hypothetical protein BGZ96_000867 [Linnemannia gamsii]